MQDHTKYKSLLREYLAGKGIHPGKGGNYHCISPNHHDSDPSMTFYDDNGGRGNYVNCNSCDFSGDIFDCAGALIGKQGSDAESFKAQLSDIQRVLGDEPASQTPPRKRQTTQAKPVPLTKKQALEVYSEERIMELATFVLCKKNPDREIMIPDGGWYPYYDANGEIDLIAVRFIDSDGKKDILSFYWTGKAVKMKGYPVLLYNRHHLVQRPGDPVMIHEGEKCCDIAAEHLPEYVHTTWNGGGKKVKNIQGLEVLKGREIFLLPDDDKPGSTAMDELKIRLEALT